MPRNPPATASETPGFPTNSSLDRELELLYRRIDYERFRQHEHPRYFKLNAMRSLLRELGNPQSRYRIVHVAGTKGKGSVCQMIAGSLVQSGIRTGRYSSPHILHLNERIEVDGLAIPDDHLAGALETVRRATERLARRRTTKSQPPSHSFFEVITATALLYFAHRAVEYVVLEVGLGGRLDSTNVCLPELCVITNISLDHTRQLGNVVDKIAREKAGIIKQGIPVISGATHPLASREIRESCSVRNARLMELGRDFSFEISGMDPQFMNLTLSTRGQLPGEGLDSARAGSLRTGTADPPPSGHYNMQQVRLNVVGDHQAENAAVALAALQTLHKRDQRVSESAMRRALAMFALPGRCEVVSRHPLVVVDMAHNVASVAALVATLRQLTAARRCPVRRLIFASSEDKDLRGMLVQLLPEFDQIIFTKFLMNPRATEPRELLETAGELLDGPARQPKLTVNDNPDDAWQSLEPGPDDLICIAGSAFLVAEMRPLIPRSAAAGRPPGSTAGSENGCN